MGLAETDRLAWYSDSILCLIQLPSLLHQLLLHNRHSVQSLSHVRLFAMPWTTARQASLSITNSRSLPKLMSIESVMPSNYLILCHPLLLLPSIFSSIRLFSNKSTLHEVAKVLEFQLEHQSFQRTPRTGLLQNGLVGSPAVQGTLKSFLQHHSSKASILRCSAFFIVWLSHPYMTTGKTIAFTRRTFVDNASAS